MSDKTPALSRGFLFDNKDENGKHLDFDRMYYNEQLSANIAKTKIALAFEAQLVDSLPTTADDIPVDIIVTEKRTIRVIKSID